MPQRVQLSRQKGWRMPPNTVKVDRTTKWGNPFVVGDNPWGREPIGREESIELFRMWFNPEWNGGIEQLRGKNLACWCKPGEPCHADVLLELANAPSLDLELPRRTERSAVA